MCRKHTLGVVDFIKSTSYRAQEDNSYGLNLATLISVASEAKVPKLSEQLDRELAEGSLAGPSVESW